MQGEPTYLSGALEAEAVWIRRPPAPVLSGARLAAPLVKAREALAAWTERWRGSTRAEICRSWAASLATRGRVRERAAGEPWRDPEAELAAYERAAGIPVSLSELVSAPVLSVLHRALLDCGNPVVRRFSQPGVLRDAPGGLLGPKGKVTTVLVPAEKIGECLAELARLVDRSLRENEDPILLAALLCYQIAAIHPFRDGNGRLARLVAELVLTESRTVAPALPLTPVLRAEHGTYVSLLGKIDRNGAWEPWIEFFCDAIVRATAEAGPPSKPAPEPQRPKHD